MKAARILPRCLAGRAVFVLACLVWLGAGAFGAEGARSAEDWRRISVFLRDTLVRKHPDLVVVQTAADYFGPGDAALEAALAYTPTTTPLK